MQTSKIIRFVAIGDSLTEGIWDWGQGDCHAGFAYVLADQLRQQEPGLEFHNLGAGGARTADVLQKQVNQAIQLKPDILTLLVGANDVPATPEPLFRQQYDQLIARINGGVKGLVLVGNIPNAAQLLPEQWVPYQSLLAERVQVMNATIMQATQRYGIALVDLYSHPATADRRNVSKDGLHPNPRGYRLLAQAFADVLSEKTGMDLMIAGT
ncbi:MAG: SGNH/GDSL hydrolase family protein [Herpetosiphonaceae bacterium]|nr:SGNH/GDSL hydrolase family protein [Herpetosiphonaceae bacterium]